MSASNGIISRNGYRFIKGYEGFAAYPCYFNGESFRTYGYGITESYQPTYYSKLGSPPCTERLAAEVYGEMVVNSFGVPLSNRMKRDGIDVSKIPINKFDAFVSLAMNSGLGGCTSSPMYQKFIININDSSISTDWLTYATNGGLAGLVARRKAESDIFKSSIYEFRTIIKYDSNGNISGTIEGDGYIPSIFIGGTGQDGNRIVESAKKMIGKPYRWGGNYPPISDYLGTDASDGTDCSGLVQWAYNDAGYPLDNTVRHTTWTLVEMGESISLNVNMWKAGDLLFNPTCEHVQIYTGNNSVIEAQQDGVPIKESNLWMEVADVRRLITWGEGGEDNTSNWFFKYGAKPLYNRRLGRW